MRGEVQEVREQERPDVHSLGVREVVTVARVV